MQMQEVEMGSPGSPTTGEELAREVSEAVGGKMKEHAEHRVSEVNATRS